MVPSIEMLARLTKKQIDGFTEQEADAFFLLFEEVKQKIGIIFDEFDINHLKTPPQEIKKHMEVFAKSDMPNTINPETIYHLTFFSSAEPRFAYTIPKKLEMNAQTAAQYYLDYQKFEAVLKEKSERVNTRLETLKMESNQRYSL